MFRSLLAILLTSLLISSPAFSGWIIKPVSAGTVALVFQEEFGAPGYENVWLETDPDGAIDDASTAQVPPGGAYAWFMEGSAKTDGVLSGAYHDNGSSFGSHYGRAYVYIDSATPNSDEFSLVLNSSTSPGSSVAMRMQFGVAASAFFIRAFAYNVGSVTTTVSSNTWYLVEWHYNNGTLDWRIDGVDQTSISGAAGRSSRYIHISNTELAEGYIGRIAISTEGWIGTQ